MTDKPKLKKGQHIGHGRDAFEDQSDIDNFKKLVKEEEEKEAAKQIHKKENK